ncbi:neural cell adhesion molecule 2-like isoform X1 [Clavelina lepadiformis]|uniref:neural cell adhesion molecule 2-like isoform X1 n=1 Tax=Clavelina lepadiformis TaxID=159417 RepID=UPI0040421E65
MKIVLVFGLLFAAAVDGQDVESSAIRAALGKNVVIPCNYNLSEDETFVALSWKRGDGDIVIMGATKEANFQDAFKGRATMSGYDLYLYNLTLDDTNTYTCTLFTSRGSSDITHNIEVLASPSVSTKIFPLEMSPSADDWSESEANLAQCTATGGSQPFTIKWVTASENEVIVDENSRNNSENPDNNKLVDSILNLTIFPDPELNNRRQVTCLVEDALGQVAESTVTLEVTVQTTTPATTTMQASPRIIDFPPNKVTAVAQSVFECRATGVPAPTVTWYRGEEKLAEGIGSAEVVLIPAQYKDSGDYTCFAENDKGKESKTLQFTVEGAPKYLENAGELNETESIHISAQTEVVQLTCQAKAVPKASFEWIVEGTNTTNIVLEEVALTEDTVTKSTVNLSASFFNAEPVDVKCVATNIHGEITRKFTVLSLEPVPQEGNVGLIVGLVVAALIILSFVFFISFYLFTSRRTQKAEVTSESTTESGCGTVCSPVCFTSSPCTKQENTNEDVSGEVNDQVKEVDEEGTSEEKQKLTKAEEQPAEKDKEEHKVEEATPEADGVETEENEDEKETEKAKGKKKLRISMPTQCCRGNREELKDEDSVSEEETKEKGEEEPPKDGNKDNETDADSGKGDTLEKNIDEKAK